MRRKERNIDAGTSGSGSAIKAIDKRSRLLLIAVIVGLVSIPFAIAYLTGTAAAIVFPEAISASFGVLFDLDSSATVFITTIVMDILALALVGLSVAFLFEIEFSSKFVSAYGGTRWWQVVKHLSIKEKRMWHILLGYFITISLATSALANTLLVNNLELDPTFTRLQAQIAIVILAAPVILIARVFSTLDIEIIDTNIGFFIIVLYLGAIFFEIWIGRVPFYQYAGLISSDLYPPPHSFTVFLSTVIISIVFAVADVTIMKHRMRKPV